VNSSTHFSSFPLPSSPRTSSSSLNPNRMHTYVGMGHIPQAFFSSSLIHFPNVWLWLEGAEKKPRNGQPISLQFNSPTSTNPFPGKGGESAPKNQCVHEKGNKVAYFLGNTQTHSKGSKPSHSLTILMLIKPPSLTYTNKIAN